MKDGAVECRHCNGVGFPPELAPYLVTNSDGKFIHVWLHDRCSEPWHVKYREWQSKLAATRK